MIDVFGHIGYVFILLGLYFLAKKRKEGWIFRFIGEFIWLILGIVMAMSSIVIWGVVFMAIDLFAYRRWRENE